MKNQKLKFSQTVILACLVMASCSLFGQNTDLLSEQNYAQSYATTSFLKVKPKYSNATYTATHAETVTKKFRNMKVETTNKYNGQLVLATEIAKLLENSSISSSKFLVVFLFNSMNQLLVLDCSDKAKEGFIQAALNYKVIENHGYETNRIYTMPITYMKK